MHARFVVYAAILLFVETLSPVESLLAQSAQAIGAAAYDELPDELRDQFVAAWKQEVMRQDAAVRQKSLSIRSLRTPQEKRAVATAVASLRQQLAELKKNDPPFVPPLVDKVGSVGRFRKTLRVTEIRTDGTVVSRIARRSGGGSLHITPGRRILPGDVVQARLLQPRTWIETYEVRGLPKSEVSVGMDVELDGVYKVLKFDSDRDEHVIERCVMPWEKTKLPAASPKTSER